MSLRSGSSAHVTGWERHQWCKPTFGSVGENVNSVYALTVFTYSTFNSIPKV
jgi:hypothetical protein